MNDEINHIILWIGNLFVAGALFLHVCNRKSSCQDRAGKVQEIWSVRGAGLSGAMELLLEFAVYSAGMIRLMELIMRQIQAGGESSLMMLGVRILSTESMLLLFIVVSMLYARRKVSWEGQGFWTFMRKEGESNLSMILLLVLILGDFRKMDAWKVLGLQLMYLFLFFVLLWLKKSRLQEEQGEYIEWQQMSGGQGKFFICQLTADADEVSVMDQPSTGGYGESVMSQSSAGVYEEYSMRHLSVEENEEYILRRQSSGRGGGYEICRQSSGRGGGYEIRQQSSGRHGGYALRQRSAGRSGGYVIHRQAAGGQEEYTILQQRQAEYLKNVDIQYQRTRELWHDLKNHIGVLEILAEEGKLTELTDYLNSFKRDVEIRMIPTRTGCTAVDAILSDKLYYAQRKEIEISMQVCDLSEMVIPAIDLCAMLGNLLDNAIEACSRLSGQGRIMLRLKKQENFYYLTIINTALEPVREGEGYVSGKKGKDNGVGHGLGLRSVERVAHRYGGSMVTDYADGEFKVVVRMQDSTSW